MKKLSVEYDGKLVEFYGDDELELVRISKNIDLYQTARYLTYDIEEIYDGNE